jgi:hypothetical protein
MHANKKRKTFALLLLPALALGATGCAEAIQVGGAVAAGALVYETVQHARAAGTDADIKDVQLEKQRVELNALKGGQTIQP